MANKNIPVLQPYNPLDKRMLGAQVAEALIERPIEKLPPEPFIGAGVYALYYTGNLDIYKDLVEVNLSI